MHLVRVPNPLPQDLPKSDGEPVYLSSCIWWSNPPFTQIQCFNWFTTISFLQWATSCVDQKQPVIQGTSWPLSLQIRVMKMAQYQICVIQRCPILVPHATQTIFCPNQISWSYVKIPWSFRFHRTCCRSFCKARVWALYHLGHKWDIVCSIVYTQDFLPCCNHSMPLSTEEGRAGQRRRGEDEGSAWYFFSEMRHWLVFRKCMMAFVYRWNVFLKFFAVWAWLDDVKMDRLYIF